jgi:hypothetical protein
MQHRGDDLKAIINARKFHGFFCRPTLKFDELFLGPPGGRGGADDEGCARSRGIALIAHCKSPMADRGHTCASWLGRASAT